MYSLKRLRLRLSKVKGAITREQIQDLKAYGIDAIAQVEAELVNELTAHQPRTSLTRSSSWYAELQEGSCFRRYQP